MWSAVVVFVDEDVDQGLELGDGGRLVGLSAEPFLQGLLESFDFPAGGWVVGAGVLLDDVEAGEFGLEAVAGAVSAVSAGEAGGVDHPVYRSGWKRECRAQRMRGGRC